MNQPPKINPAEMYEYYFVPAMFLPWATVLLHHAALQPRERVLDVACGTGIVARQAAPLVGEEGHVSALDMNQTMLDVARGVPSPLGAKINWQEGDAMRMPFADSTFDVVLCQHGLPFIPNRESAVNEMRRVLAPDGRVLVMVLQSLALHPAFEALMESVARHLSLPVSAVATPFAMSDVNELRNLFLMAGFNKVDILSESTVARFAEPSRFVQLAVISSAAAVPAFAKLEAQAQAVLFERMQIEIAPIIHEYYEAETITVPMFAHIVVAAL